MKRIRGLTEPTPGLADYLDVETQTPRWDRFRSHDVGRSYRGLVEELSNLQHGLCGYCEIDLTERDRQVEHIVPQSDPEQGAALALDVANLITCCKGGTERNLAPDRLGDGDRYLKPVHRNRSCGEAKGNLVNCEFLGPRDLPALPSLTRVLDDGRIEADEQACESLDVAAASVTSTIGILNLNAERLRLARERHWNALNDEWGNFFGDLGLMDEAARRELLPDGDRLPKFFTTSRCYFGPMAEQVLDEQPQAWV